MRVDGEAVGAMNGRRAYVVGALTCVLILVAGAPAWADIAPRFGPTWKNNTTYGTTTRPYVWFTTSVPTGEWRSRIHDGFRQWNNVGEPLQYQWAGSDTGNFDPYTSCGSKNSVYIHYTGIDGGGGTLGRSSYCSTANDTIRYSAWIQFDSAEEWCTGTGDCFDGFLGIGANIDAWSVATHESGHVSALGHYSASSSVCSDNSSQATMCPSYKPGTERQRDLASSDIDSLRYYY